MVINRIPKRAEQSAEGDLRSTFADSGVGSALNSVDHQIIYGRRGTGKTHALRYLSSTLKRNDNISIFIDLRTVGSPEGIFDPESVSSVVRTSRVLVDVLRHIHDSILEAALDDSCLTGDTMFVDALDEFLSASTSVRVDGHVESAQQAGTVTSEGGAAKVALGGSRAGFEATGQSSQSSEATASLLRKGEEKFTLNFTDVARALRKLASSLSAHHIWILFDEWTSLPREVQPYFAAFLQRCLLPLDGFTVKIAAIEQQAVFRSQLANGQIIGIEVGADMAANLNLDDYMVFEQDEQRSRDFFLNLFHKHLTAGGFDRELSELSKGQIIPRGFTDTRSFDELVRAAEGVPRDAINIAGQAARKAGSQKISIPNIREASRQWYQSDKEKALADIPGAQLLLSWVIDRVIRDKKARGFLVNQKDRSRDILLALFESRVLHIVKRGYSAQDEPGERYDVYVIDYGAYVDLISTKNAPQGVLPLGSLEGDGYVDVPSQDLRSLRRAVLDLREFEEQHGKPFKPNYIKEGVFDGNRS